MIGGEKIAIYCAKKGPLMLFLLLVITVSAAAVWFLEHQARYLQQAGKQRNKLEKFKWLLVNFQRKQAMGKK